MAMLTGRKKGVHVNKPMKKKNYAAPRGLCEITDDVALGYQRCRVGAALPWDHERHAVRANWAKLSRDIGTHECGRGIRSGI